MTSCRGPPSSSAVSCPVSSSMPACRARTAPDLAGSITKQAVYAPRHTHSHHRSEEHTSELQSLACLGCRLLLEKKKRKSSGGIPRDDSTPGLASTPAYHGEA